MMRSILLVRKLSETHSEVPSLVVIAENDVEVQLKIAAWKAKFVATYPEFANAKWHMMEIDIIDARA